MRHYYYTIYRKDYLYKGIVLYESIKLYDSDYRFFVVCMEEESVELLNKLNYTNLIPISIKEIEEYDKRIPELKTQRGEKTYIWTAKASVPLYLFNRYEEIDRIVWLDGDTEFQSSPEPIYQQWGDYSVLLTEEKFDGEYEYLGHLVGFYNTGFMGFKRDETGLMVLNYFKERLQEWKNTEEEQVNWNDQLYVDDWTERFPNVGVVKHNGINLTPFIASRANAEEKAFVNFKGGIPYIGNTPIVLYHFMALKYYESNEYDLCYYWMKIDIETVNKLYKPYIKRCSKAFDTINAVNPDFYPSLSKRYKYIGNYFNTKINEEETKYDICTITDTEHLVQTLALYDSIKKFDIGFRMWICCEDEEAYDALNSLNLSEVYCFEPFNVIEYYHRLIQKDYRASREILKARLISLITLNNHCIKSIIYVDCDCYFHQSPKKLFDLMTEASILLVQDKTQGNGHNAAGSVMGFLRDRDGLDCLFYWVEETKKWLKDGNTSKDETDYISKWIGSYSKVKLIKRYGCFLYDKLLGTVNIRKFNEKILVNNEELILYKHEIPTVKEKRYNIYFEFLNKSKSASKKYIYLPYIKSIKNGLDMLRKISRI